MKKLVIGAALTVTLLAMPAMAQSYQPSVGSGNIVGPIDKPYAGPQIPQVQPSDNAAGAFAYQPKREPRTQRIRERQTYQQQ